MLVINLKEGEKAFIGNQVAAQIISIGRKNVELGFDAPVHIKIYREKVQQKIARTNPANANLQILSGELMDALSRLEELAKKLGTTAEKLLMEMIHRFGESEA